MTSETTIREGMQVRHIQSRWAGPVLEVADDDGGMGQGPLVTVRPTHPRPKELFLPKRGRTPAGFVPLPDWWRGWKPITVTAAELEVLEEG